MAPDIGRTQTQDMDNQLSQLTAPSKTLDVATTQGKNTGWQAKKWKEYNGYYRSNRGGTKAKIDKFAMWAVGKGFKADKETTETLNEIRGFGKDSFNSIMENMSRVKKINGDSYAEVIRDKTIKNKINNIINKITLGFVRYQPGTGKLINLKPLNPGTMKTIVSTNGMLIEYEQSPAKEGDDPETFQPNEIFHLINDREADEIHGISVYEGMSDNLDKIQQLDNDMATVYHRYVMPLMKFTLDTDDEAKISAFKIKAKKVLETGDPLFIPKGAVEADALGIPQFATLDPLKWRDTWQQDSVMDIGIPELVLGRASDITEASAKIVYLSFQQTVEDEQRYIEEQVKLQLGLEIEYEFPARIEENLGEDEGKDGKINTGKKSEVTITSEKVKSGTGNPV